MDESTTTEAREETWTRAPSCRSLTPLGQQCVLHMLLESTVYYNYVYLSFFSLQQHRSLKGTCFLSSLISPTAAIVRSSASYIFDE